MLPVNVGVTLNPTQFCSISMMGSPSSWRYISFIQCFQWAHGNCCDRCVYPGIEEIATPDTIESIGQIYFTSNKNWDFSFKLTDSFIEYVASFSCFVFLVLPLLLYCKIDHNFFFYQPVLWILLQYTKYEKQDKAATLQANFIWQRPLSLLYFKQN